MRTKILIIRLSSIGDVLLSTPLIRILKKKFPSCQIDFIIKKEFHELLAYHPYLRKIFIYDKNQGRAALRDIKTHLKEEHYDLVVDIHKNFRSIYLRTGLAVNEVAKFKKYILKRWLLVNFKYNCYRQIVPVFQRYINSLKDYNLEYDNAGLDLYIPPEVNQKIAAQWDELLTNKFQLVIGLAPGASFLTKRWPVQGFSEVTKYLVQQLKAAVLLFGNGEDKTFTTEIKSTIPQHVFDVAGKLSLLETAALMNYCQLVVTNDSGLMHIASALKKKVVAIFGSTTEELGFFPYTTNSLIVQNENLKCRPCSHVGLHKCPKKHFKCMKDIKAQQVIEAVESYPLKNRGSCHR